jgi:hypothetical protein
LNIHLVFQVQIQFIDAWFSKHDNLRPLEAKLMYAPHLKHCAAFVFCRPLITDDKAASQFKDVINHHQEQENNHVKFDMEITLVQFDDKVAMFTTACTQNDCPEQVTQLSAVLIFNIFALSYRWVDSVYLVTSRLLLQVAYAMMHVPMFVTHLMMTYDERVVSLRV